MNITDIKYTALHLQNQRPIQVCAFMKQDAVPL